jgi:PKD repeat protein
MKKLLGLMAVLTALGLGTSVFANAFTPGNVVVLRFGDGTQPLTNWGQTVFLDEYTTSSIAALSGSIFNSPVSPVQSIQMPTAWVGNQAPLICAPPGTAEGLMTLSQDGRFLVLTGFGGTIGQLTNSALAALKAADTNSFDSTSTTNAVTEEDIPRVVGLVDGYGHIYTSTTITNVSENDDDIRSAASTDGTNIWLAGNANLVKYTTRGSLMATQVCANTSLSPLRAVGIFGNTLYIDKASELAYPTNTSATVNPFGGGLPVVSIATNFVPATWIGMASGFGFTMFNLANANQGGAAPDTLYMADSATNFPGEPLYHGGAVLKYCYVGGSWTYEGYIGAQDAYAVAGYKNIVGSQTNVNLVITSGTNNWLFIYSDVNAYNNGVYNDAPIANAYTAGNGALINVRGIAAVPQGGDAGTLSAGAAQITVGPPYGPYFRGPQAGPFAPSGGFNYSVFNPGSTMSTCTVSFTGFSPNTWVTATPSSTTLSPGTGTTITITPSTVDGANSTNASELVGGQTYTGKIIFRTGNGASKVAVTNVATMVIDAFYVTPTTDFDTVGPVGGPFVPSSAVYVLSNATPGALSFSAYLTNGAWASVSPASGSVPGFSSQNITVSITTNANSIIDEGSYDDQLVLSNATAGTMISVSPKVILQVGFGFFDDFSTFAPGNVVGQNSWLGNLTDVNPVQIVDTTIPGSTIASNVYVVPGGCVNSLGTSQQPYKYIAAGPLTNAYFGCVTNIVGTTTNITGCVTNPTYAVFGVMITFTNGPTDPNYVFSMGSVFLTWDDAGILDVGDHQHYVWTTELNAYETGGGPHGTIQYNYGQQYQVYFVADFVDSNAWVFVNPGTSDFVSMLSTTAPAVWSYGQTCSSCAGVSAQGWDSAGLGQYSSCSAGGGTLQPGYFATKAAASTNYAAVYNFLNPAPAASAPTASFTAAPISGAAPLTVNFTDTSTGTPTSWAWTFGDGGTSTTESPSYIYALPGTYTATLIASNAGGSSTDSTAIVVYDPYAWWQSSSVYNLTGTLTGGNASYTGDGMSNTNKFMAGFSPVNAAAYLHIISVSKAVVAGQTNVTVTYLGASGDNTYTPAIASRTNILEYSTGTGNGSYTNSFLPTGQTNILSGGAGLGTNASMTDSGIPASNDRYYRVRVLLP